ncbi:hypothetical protein N5D88_15870 [Aeromonas caviae]|uniref:hypothetical protein n=1 Tax=Aeromonas caviae TaxID=648 RepID=UPI0024488951|nr:hypothetical protein [Aeromonas caviae]MDH1841860.1 hypothetical protein [Aeromonas caviae]
MDDIYISFSFLTINLMIAIGVICFMLWRYTQPYRGPGIWLVAVLIQIAGLLLNLYITSKGTIFYAVVSHGLTITSDSLLVIGVYRFLNLKEKWLLVTVCPSVVAITISALWVMGFREAEWGVVTYSITSSVLIFKISSVLWLVANQSKKFGLERILSLSFFFLMLMTLLDAIVASINLSSYSTHLNKVISFSYFVSYNIGVPVWIVNLMGLALLVMNQVIRDSQKNAKSAQIMANRFLITHD